ncbi:NUDIX hydrolase [Sinosporangium siamense]|nr:NUDIX domain-containing protein [Sinosporangium siamense]
MRQQVTVDVHIILRRDRDVLLCLRQGGYASGQYCLPSGHLDDGETVVDCAVREVREEVGVTIKPAALQPASVIHHLSPEGRPRVGFFFATTVWEGEPYNAEPDKCAKISWVPMDVLPGNTVPYAAAGLAHYRGGVGIGLHGWP